MTKKKEQCPHSNTGTRIEGKNEVTYCKACGDVLGLRSVGYEPRSGDSKERPQK